MEFPELGVEVQSERWQARYQYASCPYPKTLRTDVIRVRPSGTQRIGPLSLEMGFMVPCFALAAALSISIAGCGGGSTTIINKTVVTQGVSTAASTPGGQGTVMDQQVGPL